MIAIRNELDGDMFSTPEMTGLEAVFVKILLSDCCVFARLFMSNR